MKSLMMAVTLSTQLLAAEPFPDGIPTFIECTGCTADEMALAALSEGLPVTSPLVGDRLTGDLLKFRFTKLQDGIHPSALEPVEVSDSERRSWLLLRHMMLAGGADRSPPMAIPASVNVGSVYDLPNNHSAHHRVSEFIKASDWYRNNFGESFEKLDIAFRMGMQTLLRIAVNVTFADGSRARFEASPFTDMMGDVMVRLTAVPGTLLDTDGNQVHSRREDYLLTAGMLSPANLARWRKQTAQQGLELVEIGEPAKSGEADAPRARFRCDAEGTYCRVVHSQR